MNTIVLFFRDQRAELALVEKLIFRCTRMDIQRPLLARILATCAR
jgi:hypothetical protein